MFSHLACLNASFLRADGSHYGCSAKNHGNTNVVQQIHILLSGLSVERRPGSRIGGRDVCTDKSSGERFHLRTGTLYFLPLHPTFHLYVWLFRLSFFSCKGALEVSSLLVCLRTLPILKRCVSTSCFRCTMNFCSPNSLKNSTVHLHIVYSVWNQTPVAGFSVSSSSPMHRGPSW